MGPSFQVDFPRQIPVDMTRTKHSTPRPGAERDDSLVVVVTRDGTTYVANARVLPADLSNVLRQAVRDGAQKTVYVKADARARYGDVKAALDQIRLAGLQNIVLLTEHSAR